MLPTLFRNQNQLKNNLFNLVTSFDYDWPFDVLNNEDRKAAHWTEDEKNYYYEVELPRFQKEEVQISVTNGILNIAAERKEKNKNSSFLASYHRSISIDGIKENDISAALKDGVLKITLPKTAETKDPKTKTINIE